MTRRSMANLFVSLAVLTACGPGTQTHATTPPGEGKAALDNVTMPPMPAWDHKAPPKPADQQVFLVYPSEKLGQWECVLADFGQGKLPWGTVIDKSDLADFMQQTSDLAGQFDVGRIPPPPPPPGDDDFKAKYLFDRATRVGPVLTTPEPMPVQSGSIQRSR